MRFFSTSPSVGLWAAGLVVASGCSLIASPDENLLNQSSAGGGGAASSSGSPASSGATTTASSSISASSGGGEGGEGAATSTSTSTASQGGGGAGGTGGDGAGGTGGDGGAGGGNGGAGGGTGGAGGGNGGAGGGPECVDPLVDCDIPEPGNECIVAICDAGACSTQDVAQGTPLVVGQTPGDCRELVCDGEGGLTPEDVPDNADDGEVDGDCVVTSCVGGVLQDPLLLDGGESCGDPDLDLVCDDGICKGCLLPEDCGPNEACLTRTCSAAFECGETLLDDDELVDDGDDGNCQQRLCNGGPTGSVAADSGDNDDDDVCTVDACAGTTDTHTAVALGGACTDASGFCTAAGACVDCAIDDNCGDNNLCETNNCNAGNTCDNTAFTPVNQAVGTQIPNDCQRQECDGAGTLVPDEPFNDPPVDDPTDCTNEGCLNGASTPTNRNPGDMCTEGGGLECNNGGVCVPFFCTGNADCNPFDTFCSDSTCTIATGVCNGTPQNENAVIGTDTLTDCEDLRCVGGSATLVDDNAETPPQDGNVCTLETCSGGTSISTATNENGLVGTDTPTDCFDVRCVSGVVTNVTDNTETPTQDANVCTAETCSGGSPVSNNSIDGGACSPPAGGECLAGIFVECTDDNECNTDTECTNFSCNGSNTCIAANANQGTACTVGGVVCNGSGICGPVTLVSQNFNGLPNSGSPTLADFTTALSGWTLANTNSAAFFGTGSSATGGIYSFGAAAAGERALGGQSSGGTDAQGWGVCFTNSSASTLLTINVAYTGEQWRNSGEGAAHTTALSFSTAAAFTSGIDATEVRAANTGNDATGWEGVAALGFTGPIATGGASALDGNLPANRTAVSGSLPGLTLANGATACVRWLDTDDTGNDHGLGIDDLLITGL